MFSNPKVASILFVFVINPSTARTFHTDVEITEYNGGVQKGCKLGERGQVNWKMERKMNRMRRAKEIGGADEEKMKKQDQGRKGEKNRST